MKHGGAPPRWARALLDASLPRGAWGSSVRADLEQEFVEVRAREGLRSARRWFAWEAVKLAGHYAADRLRRSAEDEDKGGGMMDELTRNVRLALRRLGRGPGFAAVAIVTIGLGIGANVTIFSLVDGVLLAPLPYRDSDRLVAIWEENAQRAGEPNVANPGNFAAWRDRAASFEAMSAVSLGMSVTLGSGGEVEELWGQYAHPDYFQVLGLEAEQGRTFVPGSADEGSTEVVLSHRFWSSRFGGDPSVVGRSVTVNGNAAVVVGVLPPEHVLFGSGTDVWIATPLDVGNQTNTGRWVMVVGRLAPGVSFEAAASELDAVAAGLREEFPDFNAGWSVMPIRVLDQVVGEVRRPLWLLMGSVALLLLIACANVANLMLVRATERQKEMAVRTSLGASGRTLAKQLLTESLLIAALGASLGFALGWSGVQALVTYLPDAFALPRLEGIQLNGAVLAYTVVLTSLAGILFGLLPAVHAVRSGPAATLNAESRGPSRRSGRVRNALVVTEVAVSVMLLAGAALLGRSLAELLAVDSGIEAEHVLAGRVNLVGDRYAGGERARTAFFSELMDRLNAAPGVEAAGGIGFLPLDGSGAATSFHRLDRPIPPPADIPVAWIMNVSGRYFDAMGIHLLQGRLLETRDDADAPRAIVISREMAERLYSGENPLGKRLAIEWRGDEPWEIVGVVEDVRMEGLDQPLRPGIYMSYAQSPTFRWQQVVARASGDPSALAPMLRNTLTELDRDLGIGDLREMGQVLASSTARPRLTAFLMTVFAGLATVLSTVGLYGLLSYAVSQREREIGVRIAVGARPRDVVRMVVRQGARLVLGGLTLGVLGALVGGRLVASLLFGVRPTDPWSLGAAGILLAAVAVLACAVPAWRASRVAPVEALRGD
jgi:putative ABC transport system permease protein